jgi:hypothetical protein
LLLFLRQRHPDALPRLRADISEAPRWLGTGTTDRSTVDFTVDSELGANR